MMRPLHLLSAALSFAAILSGAPALGQVGELDDSGSKGDVSTENSPNLGQQKQQEAVEGKTDGAKDSGKNNPDAKGDRHDSTNSATNRPDRPHRIERPPRPERPHR